MSDETKCKFNLGDKVGKIYLEFVYWVLKIIKYCLCLLKYFWFKSFIMREAIKKRLKQAHGVKSDT